jgi:GT2 family glycosyltransferase
LAAQAEPQAMRMQPSVWLVVLHWGQLGDTLECLDSLRGLTYPNCHVVVVDNGSTAGLPAAVRERLAATHVLDNGRNLGFAEGNNVGMRYALARGADYLLLLNNDTVAPPETLSQLVSVAERHPSIGMTCPVITSYYDHSWRFVTEIDWERGRGAEALFTPTGAECCEVEYASGCALLVKAVVARRIGLLDPAYFAYYEDADWSLRCRKAGYRVVLAPQAQVFHKGTPDRTRHKPPVHWYYYLRNQSRFIRRHAPWRRRWALLGRYTRECLEQYQHAALAGDGDEAGAVFDGWWAGLTGRYGARRIETSAGFKRFALRRLSLLLWLTAPVEALRRRFPVRTTLRRLWRARAQSPE